MLASVPPGLSWDIAPAWMVNESSLYSKQERQRIGWGTSCGKGKDGQRDGEGHRPQSQGRGGGNKSEETGRGKARGGKGNKTFYLPYPKIATFMLAGFTQQLFVSPNLKKLFNFLTPNEFS